ncbi:hypothetical protein EG68_05395 [Paragonimus skrjabini miyazakii]|uniref:Uncharacterized protein n=1 Tax=Paragonimus skrjabini miyazakii TaxID=59628 RepID=A0A8S9YS72_9TREM|nr:hypothetical protein EG68_05395 [Paragonimus skrjabini miyazakii]
MLSELLKTVTLFITFISTTIGDGEQTPQCQPLGNKCAWLPEDFCCEGAICMNDVCTKCKAIGESCLNSNECCKALCIDMTCTEFEAGFQKAAAQGLLL